MNLLVLNAGSGSQKCSLFQLGENLPDEPLEPVWEARIEATSPQGGADQLLLTLHHRGEPETQQMLSADIPRTERLEHLLKSLWQGAAPIVNGPEDIHLVGHRVVHGGAEFEAAVLVDNQVETAIQRLAAFAPLHNPVNLEGIQIARKILGCETPQIAVFDTSFHRTLADAAAVYPGPHAWLDQGIRRYGFHGTSFRWAGARAAKLLGRPGDPELRLIICHLGGGCSLTATIGGRSVDTTMGFTPLDGIAMCTRSGALDPGILLFLLRQNNDVDRLEKILNKESGLAGLSGLPGDTRILVAEAQKGNERARLALDVFVHRLCAGMGQMLAALGGRPDAIVFTDAISEDEPSVRARACAPFRFLGVEIDVRKNERSPLDADIALPESAVRVLIVKSREDWQIARECHPFFTR